MASDQNAGDSFSRVFGGQPQILVRAHAKERREIVQAGDRVAGGCQIGRRLGIKRRPVGADHGGGKMPAGGMADDEHRPIKQLPQGQASAAHLLDDVGDGDDRAQVITRNRDRDAVRVQAARHVAEHRRIERAPIAAMDEQRQRRRGAGLRMEQIEILPRRVAVSQAELGAARFERVGAIKLGVARPAGENLRMLRHAGAIVIFGFVVDCRHRRLPAFRIRLRQGCPASKPPKQ